MSRVPAAMLVLCLWINSAPAWAAWLQTKGEGLIISSLSSYHSNARFDRLGLRSPGRDYRKQELFLYGEYGLADRLTLGAKPVFFRLRTDNLNRAGQQGMKGLSQVELFARTRIFVGDFWIVSAQALVKIPGANSFDREPFIEAPSRDLEGRILFGRSGRLARQSLNLEYFSSIEAGYRVRDRNAAGQWRADATFGVRPVQKYQIIVQSFNILSSRGPDDSDPTAYDLFKAQISAVRDLPHGMALQAGVSSEFSGRNIGAGNALFLAVWSRF